MIVKRVSGKSLAQFAEEQVFKPLGMSLSSRGDAEYQDKLLSAMRYQFGGHVEKPDGKQAA